jgi:hypothetical protein
VSAVDYDLRYLQGGIGDLENYLLSPQLQWPLGLRANPSEAPYPPLTIENLLLARQRLVGRDLSTIHVKHIEQFDLEFQKVRACWRVAWGEKAARGFHHRLGLWQHFLNEWFTNPPSERDRYPYEVRLRVMLELLQSEVKSLPPETTEQLAGLDKRLHSTWQPGGFVWLNELQAAFPIQPYWFLYGSPKS